MKIIANKIYFVDGVKMKCHISRTHGVHTFQVIDEWGKDIIIRDPNNGEVKDWGTRTIDESKHEIKEI